MIAGWAAEGVGTDRVLRLSGKLPGIYLIQTDDKGERRFFHWRENAAGAQLMNLPETDRHAGLARELRSGLSLGDHAVDLQRGEDRAQLFAALRRARERWNARMAFDTNFRIRGWPDLDVARAVYRRGLCGSRYRTRLERRICCRSMPATATTG